MSQVLERLRALASSVVDAMIMITSALWGAHFMSAGFPCVLFPVFNWWYGTSVRCPIRPAESWWTILGPEYAAVMVGLIVAAVLLRDRSEEDAD